MGHKRRIKQCSRPVDEEKCLLEEGHPQRRGKPYRGSIKWPCGSTSFEDLGERRQGCRTQRVFQYKCLNCGVIHEEVEIISEGELEHRLRENRQHNRERGLPL